LSEILITVMQGDPVWAISQATISDLIGLSLNFFFILPLLNSGKHNFHMVVSIQVYLPTLWA